MTCHEGGPHNTMASEHTFPMDPSTKAYLFVLTDRPRSKRSEGCVDPQACIPPLALFQDMLDGDCKTVYTSHRSKLQSWACLTSTMISDTSYKHASSRTRHKSFLAAYSQRTCRVRAPYLQLSEKRACSVPSSPSSDSSSSSFSSPFLHSLRGSSVVFLLHTCSVPAAYLQRTCSVERSSLLEF